MTIIKTALVAASLVAVVATAHAQSREDLNSGYHGNSPVWSAPYGPSDAIPQEARESYGRSFAPAPQQERYRANRPVQPRAVR
jgi:hypothetical protein